MRHKICHTVSHSLVCVNIPFLSIPLIQLKTSLTWHYREKSDIEGPPIAFISFSLVEEIVFDGGNLTTDFEGIISHVLVVAEFKLLPNFVRGTKLPLIVTDE